MFDDDLDITELDQALLGGKTPLSSQKAQEKDDTMKNHNSAKTKPVLTSRRYMFYCMITAIFEVIIIDFSSKKIELMSGGDSPAVLPEPLFASLFRPGLHS